MKPPIVTWPEFTFTSDPDDRFRAGDPFWSPDGRTWVRGLPPPVIVDPRAPRPPTTVVTGVDRERGIITVEAK